MPVGISIIRTSVVHSTAFDIARRSPADPSSLIAALGLAATMV